MGEGLRLAQKEGRGDIFSVRAVTPLHSVSTHKPSRNLAQQVEYNKMRPNMRHFTINRAFQPGMQRFPAVTRTCVVGVGRVNDA